MGAEMSGRPWRAPALALALAAAAAAGPANAGLFDDEEARKAILDLRARIQAVDESGKQALGQLGATNARLVEQVAALQRSVLELNNQIEMLRGEIATLRGNGEQTLRDVGELQRLQKDAHQNFDERLRRFEPQKVSLDGIEFNARPAEKQAYDEAIATIRNGDFAGAAQALAAFQTRWPDSGYLAAARFWEGNALYGKRDYKGAIAAFRKMIADAPSHPKAPEALLAVANSQAEMKDRAGARKTLDALIKDYPDSEAAIAGKERLAALK
jgi:tol-pal system protein YbgF